jgi:hypothetical protein
VLQVEVSDDEPTASAIWAGARPVVPEFELEMWRDLLWTSQHVRLQTSHAAASGSRATDIPASAGVVLAYDEDCLADAEIWGAVLRRRVGGVLGSPDRLPGDSAVTLVIPDRRITVDAMIHLVAASVQATTSLGFVQSERHAARRHQLLSALGCTATARAYMHDWIWGPASVAPDTVVCGAADDLTAILPQGRPAAIFIASHSDGASLPVGPHVVCARMAAQTGPASGRALPCFYDGACLRGEGPAAAPEAYVDPRKLAADALILDMCWGNMPTDGLFEPNATVAGVLLENACARNILAPINVIESSRTRLSDCLARFLAGASLGELTLELNQDREAEFWILLGDPEVRSAARIPVESANRSGRGWRIALGSANPLRIVELTGSEDLAPGPGAVIGPVAETRQVRLGGGLRRPRDSRVVTILECGRDSGETAALESLLIDADPQGDSRSRSSAGIWIEGFARRRALDALVARCSARGDDEATRVARSCEQVALDSIAILSGEDLSRDHAALTRAAYWLIIHANSLDRQLCELLCRAAGKRRDEPVPPWADIMVATGATRAAQCCDCGADVVVATWEAGVLPGEARQLVSCASCRLLADWPSPCLAPPPHGSRNAPLPDFDATMLPGTALDAVYCGVITDAPQTRVRLLELDGARRLGSGHADGPVLFTWLGHLGWTARGSGEHDA